MKILIASSINKAAIEKLKEKHDVVCAFNAPEETLISAIVDIDILIFRSGVKISTEVLKHGSNLKLLIRAGSGLDNIDINYVNDDDKAEDNKEEIIFKEEIDLEEVEALISDNEMNDMGKTQVTKPGKNARNDLLWSSKKNDNDKS